MKNVLTQKLKKQNLPHSLIFQSDDEVALSEASLYFSKMVICQSSPFDGTCIFCKKIDHNTHADVLSFPQEKQNITVDEMLKIIEEANTTPFEGKDKVIILNNFDETNVLAQNKLLKTLEEPRENVFFVLNVKNESQVLPTIMSRCQKIYLPKYSSLVIEEKLSTENISPSQKSDVIAFCGGAIKRAEEFLKNENFFDVIDLVFSVWKEYRKSSTALVYASKLYSLKENLSLFFYLYNFVLEEVLYVKLGLDKFVKNQKRIDEYREIAKDFSNKALQEIVKYLNEINEKIQKNCNQNIIIDNFLMKILEVKAKWL